MKRVRLLSLLLLCGVAACLFFCDHSFSNFFQSSRTEKVSFDALCRITVTKEDGAYSFKRKGACVETLESEERDVEWWMEGYSGVALQADVFGALLDALRSMDLSSALERSDLGESAEYGLGPRAARIELDTGGESKTAEYVLGAYNAYLKKCYLESQPSGELYLTNCGLHAAVLKPGKEFLDKQPLKFLPDDINSLSIEASGRDQIKIDKLGSGWRVNGKPGDKTFILQLLRDLASFRVHEYMPAPKTFQKLQELELRINFEIKLEDRIVSHKLIIGDCQIAGTLPGAACRAYVDDLKELLIIDMALLRSLSPREEVLLRLEENSKLVKESL